METWIEVILMGLSLSMDAMAAAVTVGLCKEGLRLRDAGKTGIFFGSFQALMPLLGYFLGLSLSHWIKPIDHWVAGGLLAIIGIGMLKEGVELYKSGGELACATDPTATKALLIMAVATSIDALAAGISLSLITPHVVPAVLLIGSITFVLSFVGVMFGRFLGQRFRIISTLSGGLVLIALGIKVVIQHIILGI